jgi:hypothetical protein
MSVHAIKPGPLRIEFDKSILPDIDDPNQYCRACNHRFSSKNYYKVHLIAVHNMKPKRTRMLPRTNTGILPDVNDPDYYCRPCNYQYKMKNVYKRHLTIVHDMKLKPLIIIRRPT